MKAVQGDSVVLKGGQHDGARVMLDFVEDSDVDVIAIGDGPKRALYTFNGSEWKYDRTARLDSIDRIFKVLEVPGFEFETTRSFGTSTKSSSMAAFQAELRNIGRAGTTVMVRTIREMQARGASLPEMLEKIRKLQAELHTLMLETAIKNHHEYERKKVEYAKLPGR